MRMGKDGFNFILQTYTYSFDFFELPPGRNEVGHIKKTSGNLAKADVSRIKSQQNHKKNKIMFYSVTKE